LRVTWDAIMGVQHDAVRVWWCAALLPLPPLQL
jgi:hypothetical protein